MKNKANPPVYQDAGHFEVLVRLTAIFTGNLTSALSHCLKAYPQSHARYLKRLGKGDTIEFVAKK